MSSVVDNLSPGAVVGSFIDDEEPDDRDDLDDREDPDEDLEDRDDLEDLEALDDPLPEPRKSPKKARDSNGNAIDSDTARISIHSLPELNCLHMGCLLSQAAHLVEGSITLDPAYRRQVRNNRERYTKTTHPISVTRPPYVPFGALRSKALRPTFSDGLPLSSRTIFY